MRGKPIAIFLDERDLRFVENEANNAFPNETGGVLLGTLDASGSIRVTDVIGPGSAATHRPTSFIPDYAFQEAAIAKAYEASGRTKAYLGDWHTHPSGPASLSRIDKATLFNISRHDPARASCPMMLLASGTVHKWSLKAWQLRGGKLTQVQIMRFPSS